jgi:hypothetical protein
MSKNRSQGISDTGIIAESQQQESTHENVSQHNFNNGGHLWNRI